MIIEVKNTKGEVLKQFNAKKEDPDKFHKWVDKDLIEKDISVKRIEVDFHEDTTVLDMNDILSGDGNMALVTKQTVIVE